MQLALISKLMLLIKLLPILNSFKAIHKNMITTISDSGYFFMVKRCLLNYV